MGTVHRGKARPQAMRWKSSVTFADFAFNEGRLVAWARANLTGPMTYDYIVYHNSKNKFSKHIEFIAWFGNKADFMAFEKEWA